MGHVASAVVSDSTTESKIPARVSDVGIPTIYRFTFSRLWRSVNVNRYAVNVNRSAPPHCERYKQHPPYTFTYTYTFT